MNWERFSGSTYQSIARHSLWSLNCTNIRNFRAHCCKLSWKHCYKLMAKDIHSHLNTLFRCLGNQHRIHTCSFRPHLYKLHSCRIRWSHCIHSHPDTPIHYPKIRFDKYIDSVHVCSDKKHWSDKHDFPPDIHRCQYTLDHHPKIQSYNYTQSFQTYFDNCHLPSSLKLSGRCIHLHRCKSVHLLKSLVDIHMRSYQLCWSRLHLDCSHVRQLCTRQCPDSVCHYR